MPTATVETADPAAAFAAVRARRDQIRSTRRRLEQEVERLQAQVRTDVGGDEGAAYIERVLAGEPLGDVAAPGARVAGIADQLAQAKRQLALVVEAHCRFQPTFEAAEGAAAAHAARQVLPQHREILRRQVEHVLALAELAEAEAELIGGVALPVLSFPGVGNRHSRDSLVSRWLNRLRQHGVDVAG